MKRNAMKAWSTAAITAVCLAAPPAAAAPYPIRPVETVVPYGAGGSTGQTARIVAQRLGDRLGAALALRHRDRGGAANVEEPAEISGKTA
jgi:tripartite-type tricarboxylate transporter receptor subunit TctC